MSPGLKMVVVWLTLSLGACTLAQAATVITYQLDRDARVSLAVYDAQGRMVRELLRAAPQPKGAQSIAWDGHDREGRPIAAGRYTWKLLASQGLQAEYLLSLGTSVGHNAWPGAHGGPCAVAVDGGTLYLAGAGAEGPPGLVSTTLDNQQYRWAIPNLNGWDGAADMAVASGKLWVHYPGNGAQYTVDPQTGKRLGMTSQQRVPLLALSLQQAPTPQSPDFTPCPLVAYSPARGYGWERLDHATVFAATRESGPDPEEPAADEAADEPLQADPSWQQPLPFGHRFTAIAGKEAVRFLVDLPKCPAYPGVTVMVRLHLGGCPIGRDELSQVHIRDAGGYKASFDAAKAPGYGTVEFTAEVMNGQLPIWFYQDAQSDKKPFVVALRGLEVFCTTDRMTARGTQLVVAARAAQRIFWHKPEGDMAPAYTALTIPLTPGVSAIGESNLADQDARLQSPVPGSMERLPARVWYANGGAYDLDVRLTDAAPHQVALYFANNQSDHPRPIRVQVLDAATNAVLDTRDATATQRGQYLVWQMQGHVKLRLTSLAGGGLTRTASFSIPSRLRRGSGSPSCTAMRPPTAAGKACMGRMGMPSPARSRASWTGRLCRTCRMWRC